MTDMALTIPPSNRRRRIGLKGFLVGLTVALLLVWTGVPLFMAVMWSLGEPGRSVVAACGAAAELFARAVGICLHLF